MSTFIRLLYALLIAAAVVTFIGIGIATFYPGPKAPTYITMPAPAKSAPDETTPQDTFQEASDTYAAEQKIYQRNVSIILAILTPIIVVGGLWLRRRTDIIGEGLALGGVGISIYAVVGASMADDRIMRFVAVTLFLASVIAVVYFKFSAMQPVAQPGRKRA